MNIHDIKTRLQTMSIFLADETIAQRPAVVGYDKRFRWRWFATQMNTFVFAIDCGDELITAAIIEGVLADCHEYATKNSQGWPRGFQSGLAAIAILCSSSIDESARTYCRNLKTGIKWAGFSVPIVVDSSTKEVHQFEKNPAWGRIYYPFFKRLAKQLVQ